MSLAKIAASAKAGGRLTNSRVLCTVARMAARKKNSTGSGRPASKPKRAKGKLAPGTQARGLEASQIAVPPDSPEIAELASLVRDAGGVPIGAYHEPMGGRPLMLACLPLAAVQPTPFQRDLSPTHAKRLAEKIGETAAFLDPLIVVRGEDGKLWTPMVSRSTSAGGCASWSASTAAWKC